MNKLLLVAMTLITFPAMGDVTLEFKLKEDHQIIKVVDAEKPTDITVSKKRVQVGKSIKVKQDGKEQSCLVNQMAITSVW